MLIYNVRMTNLHESDVDTVESYIKKAFDIIDRPDELWPKSIAEIVGVFIGIKPASLITTSMGDDLSKAIESLGIQIAPVNTAENGWVIAKESDVLISTRDITERLRKLRDEYGPSYTDDHLERELGLAMGYPKTAIDQYISRLKIHRLHDEWQAQPWTSEIPADVLGFMDFIPSRNHFSEEIDSYIKPIKKATRIYAPKAYSAIQQQAIGRAVARGTVNSD